jgi:hypothetical protein
MMGKLLALALVLLFIAPALLQRGGVMRVQEKRGGRGLVGEFGVMRFAVQVRWRVQV